MPRTYVVHLGRSAYDVYIGRAGKGHDGYFGNPIKLEHESERDKVLGRYRDYFYKRLESDPEFKRRIHELRGKILGCFCKPLKCHGDVIAEYLNSLPEGQ